MQNITSTLEKEHQIILEALQHIRAKCNEIDLGKPIDREFFLKSISFIRNFADCFHHAKEEDILFKAMLENAGQLHCNPIPVMLHEHSEGREFVRGMEKALGSNNATELLNNARGYCDLLEEHIYKEDHVLYPMAEAALPDEVKLKVLQMYGKVETELKKVMDVDKLLVT